MKAYHLQRTRFELIAERKRRQALQRIAMMHERRQLTVLGNQPVAVRVGRAHTIGRPHLWRLPDADGH